jgi:hypothetical protein
MKRSNGTSNGYIFLRLCSYSVFFFVMILFMTSCSKPKTPYSIVEFKAGGKVNNLSKSLFFFTQESDSVNPAILLANKGDLIGFNDDDYFVYSDPSQTKITFKTKNGINYVNNKINSIDMNDKIDMIPWFKEMKNTDISSLEFINFKSKINENYFPWLKELAKTKPDLGFVYGEELGSMVKLLEIFKPKFIIAADISTKDFSMISSLTNLELLSGKLIDSGGTNPLPAMPHLKQLFLTDIKSNVVLNDLLINNSQIEKLILMKSGEFDFSVIKPLTGLKELIINGFDTTINSDLVNNLKQLEVLSVTEEKFRFDKSFTGLANIRWMTFSPGTTQSDFKTFNETHPDLEVVEIVNNKLINSLQPLSNLNKIIGLTISDTLTDIATIKSLKNIKFLSLPNKVLADSVTKADLRKSLPGTLIVANHGFCLGSGWILLIIPLILFFRILSRQKSGMVQS